MFALTALMAILPHTHAHLAMWDKGMFGYNYPNQATDSTQNYNANIQITPLRQFDALLLDEWFGHGYRGYPPVAGDFMELPSGGVYTGDISCNRAFTKMGNPRRGVPLPLYACDNEGVLHTKNRFGQPTNLKLFGGTAIAIAYTSDVYSVKPNDMTVISVNQASPWVREAQYPIPAGMPPCPPGGCICSWNWIHRAANGEGYGAEIYHLLYRCKITGATNSNNRVQRGAVPKDCTNNPSACVRGPKTGLYAFQRDGNNMIIAEPPTYSDEWGFFDGAQNDIFAPAATPAPTTYLVNPYATSAGKSLVDPAPTAAALLPGWKAVGCSVDQALPNRYLGFAAYNNPANTISMCVQKCEESKFTSAGLQAGSLCYCGNATAPPNMAPDGDCSIRCPGDIWSFCGGNWRSSLFSKVDLSKAAPVAIPAPEAPADWKNLGCHQEPWGQRAINGSSASMPTMTVGKCIAYCVDKGFTFAGTQYGSQCYCGNSYTPAPTTGCDTPCGGNSTQKCGGPYKNQVYMRVIEDSERKKRDEVEPESKRDTHGLGRHRSRMRKWLDKF